MFEFLVKEESVYLAVLEELLLANDSKLDCNRQVILLTKKFTRIGLAHLAKGGLGGFGDDTVV